MRRSVGASDKSSQELSCSPRIRPPSPPPIATMPSETQTLEFQAEVREVLDLMIHSLYTNREIFLRELISNASDALDKRRLLALEDPSVELEGEPRIRLEPDLATRILSVVDNGIGMSKDEVVANIGTIASSGTREFLAELKERGSSADLPRLIGQFGVGFYSSFMVADEVVLETRRAGEESGTRWRSKGDGSYTIEDADGLEVGTSIALHLKPQAVEDGDDFHDYTSEWVLRDIVRKYSDFVEYPIEMDVEREEGEGDEKKTVTKTEVLNSRKPLWTRAKSEITDEEYTEFYKHVSHDWSEPYETIHFKAEGTSEYTALLFLPKERSFELLDPNRTKSRVTLYVKRVHIQSECEELVPLWLRFVAGVVDSDDLPLNVSRETLQGSHQLAQIKKRLTKKVLDALAAKLEEDRLGYVELWKSFGPVLKEGIYFDDGFREELARICLFDTTGDESPATLSQYVERMPVKQKSIYYLAGPERATLEQSAHLEQARAKGFEVLLLTDSVDEFAFQRMPEFEGKPIQALDRGDVDLLDEDERQKSEEQQKGLEPLLEAVKGELADDVSEVRFSSRLTDSPVALVTADNDLSPNLARILEEARQSVPHSKRVLEVNPGHELVLKMKALHDEEGTSERFADYCDLLYGQALVREGAPVPHPEHFAKLVSKLMLER